MSSQTKCLLIQKNQYFAEEYTRIHGKDAHNKQEDRNSQERNRNYKKETKIRKLKKITSEIKMHWIGLKQNEDNRGKKSVNLDI